ncbi:MAG: glycosyltransferase family 39 protein [Anaerolineae bacterium]|nr:glycosyltransferase family 39 protein [Anaerolineae bacterium]
MPHRITARHGLLLALILALAAFTRLERIGISEFRFDEALLSTLAQDWLAGGPLPLRGLIASVGLPQGPWMVYLVALPYAFQSGPVAATAFVALLNVAGVGLLWLIAQRYFSPAVAVFAALAYAASPWAVLFSRKIWNPNLHSPLLLAGVLLACYGLIERKRWSQALCVPLLLLPLQFHYQGFVLLPVFVALLWIGRRSVSWPAVAAGLLLALLTLLPFLSSLGLADVAAARSLAGGGGGELAFSDRAATYLLDFITGAQVVPAIVAADNAAAILARVPPPLPLWYSLLALFALGLVALWRHYRRFAGVLLLWLGLTPLLLTPSWVRAYAHYFVLLLPAVFLVVGLGAEWLLHTIQRRTRLPARGVWLAGGALFAGVVGSQALWGAALLTDLDTYATPAGMNTPLYRLEAIAGAVTARDVLIVGGNATYSAANIWQPIVYRQADCVRDVLINGGDIAVLPARPFAVLLPPDAAPYGWLPLYQAAATTTQTFPLRQGEGAYTLYHVPAAPEWTQTPLSAAAVPVFASGAQITGYHLAADAVYLRWRLTADPDRQTQYQYFVHFMDAAGERLGQRDSAFYHAPFRCAGDTLITRVSAEVPPGTATLRLGLYSLREGRAVNVPWLDAAGAAGGTWVEVPALAR